MAEHKEFLVTHQWRRDTRPCFQTPYRLVEPVALHTRLLERRRIQQVRKLCRCCPQVQRLLQRVHKKSVTLELEVLAEFFMASRDKVSQKLTFSRPLYLTVETSQLKYHSRQHMQTHLWMLALRRLLWTKVSKKLWKRMSALHKEALAWRLMTRELKHTEEWQLQVSELKMKCHRHDRCWWPDKTYERQLKLAKTLPEKYSLDSAWMQSEMEFKCFFSQLLLEVHFEWVRPLLADRTED